MLACDVEAELKGLDPKLSAGGIIIPGGNSIDHIKYTKAEVEKMGVPSLIYLKDFCRTEKTKMMTFDLYCDYIQ